MMQGQHHHVSHRYLYQYANHAAWLEAITRCRACGQATGSAAHSANNAAKTSHHKMNYFVAYALVSDSDETRVAYEGKIDNYMRVV